MSAQPIKRDSPKAASSHTPGPWTVDSEEIYADDNDLLFRIPTDFREDGLLTDADRANARLAAAAPDLLAALRELVERAEAEGNIDGLPEYDQARAAIAKAEGRT